MATTISGSGPGDLTTNLEINIIPKSYTVTSSENIIEVLFNLETQEPPVQQAKVYEKRTYVECDVSGSMGGNPILAVKEGVKYLAKHGQGYISVGTFNTEARTLRADGSLQTVSYSPGDRIPAHFVKLPEDRDILLNAASRIYSSGGTDYYLGASTSLHIIVQDAEDIFKKYGEDKLKNTYWSLVIISDGCSRDGQFRESSIILSELKKIIETIRVHPLPINLPTVSVIGIGDVDKNLLSKTPDICSVGSEMSEGTCNFATSPEQLAGFLAEDIDECIAARNIEIRFKTLNDAEMTKPETQYRCHIEDDKTCVISLDKLGYEQCRSFLTSLRLKEVHLPVDKLTEEFEYLYIQYSWDDYAGKPMKGECFLKLNRTDGVIADTVLPKEIAIEKVRRIHINTTSIVQELCDSRKFKKAEIVIQEAIIEINKSTIKDDSIVQKIIHELKSLLEISTSRHDWLSKGQFKNLTVHRQMSAQSNGPVYRTKSASVNYQSSTIQAKTSMGNDLFPPSPILYHNGGGGGGGGGGSSSDSDSDSDSDTPWNFRISLA